MLIVKTQVGRLLSLGFSLEGGTGMYFGLPEQIGSSKMKVFSFVQERFNGRINIW